MQSLTVRDDVQGADIVVHVLGSGPHVLVSHGSGSNVLLLRGLAEAVAAAGFTVALVEHPGNKRGDDALANSPQNLVNRPRHLRLVLDALGAEHAAVIGHSLGGYSALALAGGNPLALPDQTADGKAAPLTVEHDPRVTAVVLLAPAIPWFLAPGALDDVRVPIRMIVGERDDLSPPFFIERVLASQPVDSSTIPGAGHFAFFWPLPPALVAAKLPPALDPPGFDREAYQAELHADVIDFLTTYHARIELPAGASATISLDSNQTDPDVIEIEITRTDGGYVVVRNAAIDGPRAIQTAHAVATRFAASLRAAGITVRCVGHGRIVHNGGDTRLRADQLWNGSAVLLSTDDAIAIIERGDEVELDDPGGTSPLPLRVFVRGARFHVEDAAPDPLATYATIRQLLRAACAAVGATLRVPNAMTPDRLRAAIAAGRATDAFTRLIADRDWNGAAYGAAPLATHGGSSAWKLPPDLDGLVVLAGRDLHVVRPGDDLVHTFGGMSAAVGVVPMGIDRIASDGTRETLFSDAADEHVAGDDARELDRAMLAYFAVIAAAAGCTIRED